MEGRALRAVPTRAELAEPPNAWAKARNASERNRRNALRLCPPYLGFSHSRCVSKCIFHALPDMARNFYAVSAWPRHERNLVMPDFATYSRDCIAECQDRFWIPCGGFLVWFFWFGKIVRPPIGDSEKREKR